MKLFNQLSLGDNFYKAVINADQALDEKCITTFTVKKIEHSENDNLLLNGKWHDYGRSWQYELVIPMDKSAVTTITGLDKYTGFWFTDIEQANAHVRQLVLNRIQGHYAAIKKAERDHLYTISLLRDKYHEILNPSFHPDFNIAQ